MKGAFALVLVVGALVSAGCGIDSLRTLSESDVVGISAGDATGSLFAGHYMLTGTWKGACRCRVGSCATITIDAGPGSLRVMQTDGGLQYRNDAANAVACDGGINSDGSFACGQVQSAVGGSFYALTTGRFALANGQSPTMSGLTESTTVLPALDCDLQVGFEATYLGP